MVRVDGYSQPEFKFDKGTGTGTGTGNLIYEIPLSPQEMLYGFNKTVSYIHSTSINIDRTDKITLPNFNITIPQYGPPVLNAACFDSLGHFNHSCNHSCNDNCHNNADSHSSYTTDMRSTRSGDNSSAYSNSNSNSNSNNDSNSNSNSNGDRNWNSVVVTSVNRSDLVLKFIIEDDHYNRTDFNGTVVIDGNSTLETADLQVII